ncbi:MAG: ribulose-phosphate 3-epimerase [Balneolaceae bacterium]
MDFELPVLAPSILAADFSRLGDEIELCTSNGIKWIHCDIMDGHFVPNISCGPEIVSAVRRIAPDAFMDVHLMIEKPDEYIEAFAEAGADLISVHYETCSHLHRTLQNIQSHGCMTGVAVNPATSVDLIEPVLSEVDLALVMSVNPGFGGQSFIESSYSKIQRLVRLRNDRDTNFLIEIDGGVNLRNIQKLVQSGTDVLVAGSSIFGADSIPDRIDELHKLANLGRKDFV